ncbi:unnamed protein product [Choristocarpus tenellus]
MVHSTLCAFVLEPPVTAHFIFIIIVLLLPYSVFTWQSFYVADGKIWVRNYQIMDKGDGGVHAKRMEKAGGDETVSLVEIGPRFVLNPIRIFAGSFGGPTLYTNSAYVSANEARSARKRTAGRRYEERTESKRIVKEKKSVPAVPRGELDDVFLG